MGAFRGAGSPFILPTQTMGGGRLLALRLSRPKRLYLPNHHIDFPAPNLDLPHAGDVQASESSLAVHSVLAAVSSQNITPEILQPQVGRIDLALDPGSHAESYGH